MNKLIGFLILSLFVMGCGVATNPEDNITFQQAFNHVAKNFSYWLFIGLSVVPAAVYIFLYYRGKIDEVDLKVLFGLLVLLMIAIFIRPAEIAANTTVEMASRGVFIG